MKQYKAGVSQFGLEEYAHYLDGGESFTGICCCSVAQSWPKHWSFSFSISPSNEYSGLISFRIDSFDLPLSKSSPIPQFKSINSSVLNLLYGPTLTSIHGYWKNHSFDCMVLPWWLRW